MTAFRFITFIKVFMERCELLAQQGAPSPFPSSRSPAAEHSVMKLHTQAHAQTAHRHSPDYATVLYGICSDKITYLFMPIQNVS